jgi:hypothetical protein
MMMKKKALKGSSLLFAAAGLAATVSHGQIFSYSNDFGDGFTTLVADASGGDTGTLDTNTENGYTGALYGPDMQWQNIGFGRMEYRTNDGVNGDSLGDGHVVFNSFDTNEMGGLLSLDGTMTEGEIYNLETWVFNRNNSFVNLSVVLYNATDGVELASTGEIVLNGSLQNTGDGVLQNLSYTALASDVGDELQVRYLRNSNDSTARDIFVDSVSLTAVPEPAHAALFVGIFGMGLLFWRRQKTRR